MKRTNRTISVFWALFIALSLSTFSFSFAQNTEETSAQGPASILKEKIQANDIDALRNLISFIESAMPMDLLSSEKLSTEQAKREMQLINRKLHSDRYSWLTDEETKARLVAVFQKTQEYITKIEDGSIASIKSEKQSKYLKPVTAEEIAEERTRFLDFGSSALLQIDNHMRLFESELERQSSSKLLSEQSYQKSINAAIDAFLNAKNPLLAQKEANALVETLSNWKTEYNNSNALTKTKNSMFEFILSQSILTKLQESFKSNNPLLHKRLKKFILALHTNSNTERPVFNAYEAIRLVDASFHLINNSTTHRLSPNRLLVEDLRLNLQSKIAERYPSFKLSGTQRVKMCVLNFEIK